MELLLSPIKTESSAQFPQKSFGIGDQTVILEILRSKMYSNPIQSICQEIMSNARDAHREVGKGDLPIEITFPTHFDPNYTVRDFGPGITQQRMDEVFLLYGNSTKRGSNLETGGFGLGGKVPFAYTDQFTIISITPNDDGTMSKRTYIAHIDESRLGAISLVTNDPTTEPQGLKVIIPVKEKDYERFVEHTMRVGTWWTPQPKLLTGYHTWDKHEPTFTGEGWMLEKSENHHSQALAIIDGIQYKLDNHHFKNQQASTMLLKPTRLFFKVGELPVTSNREALDYQPWVIDLIENRLIDIYQTISKTVHQTIEAATSYREACISWKKLKNSSSFGWVAPEWKGLALTADYTIPNSNSSFDTTTRTMVREYDYDESAQELNVVSFRQQRGYWKNIELDVCTHRLILEDDTDGNTPSKPRIITALKKFNENSCVVVKFRCDKSRELANEDGIWAALDFPKLSTFEKTIIRRPTVILKIRKYEREGTTERCKGEWSPANVDVANAEGVYVTLFKGKYSINNNWTDLNAKFAKEKLDNLITRCNALDIEIPTIYAIISRWTKDVGPKMVPLGDYLAEKIKAIETPELLEMTRVNVGDSLGNLNLLVDHNSLISNLPQNHPIVKWDQLRNKQSKYRYKVDQYVALVWCLTPHHNFSKMTDPVPGLIRQYPIFTLSPSYEFSNSMNKARNLQFFLDYIHSIDSQDTPLPLLVI